MSSGEVTSKFSSPIDVLLGRWWWFALALIVAGNFALRVRLLEIPLERDEGEYAYAGQLIRQGIPPYKQAYNMKFPGTYLAYAGMMSLGGETTACVHLGFAVITSGTAILVGLLGRKIFSPMAGIATAASYVVLAATPAMFGLAGHATHLVAFLSTAGVLILYQAVQRKSLWLCAMAGALFGGAILMKQHAVLLAGAGVGWLCWQERWQHRQSTATVGLRQLLAFALGVIGPLWLVGIWIYFSGVGKNFTFWTIDYALQYATAIPLQAMPASFRAGFVPILVATWPLWTLAAVGGVIGSIKMSKCGLGLIIALTVGGLLSTVPGFHFRGHYFLAATPGLALLIGTAVAWWAGQSRQRFSPLVWGGILLTAIGVTTWNNREVWWQLSPEQAALRLYAPNPFNEAPKLADYLREHTAADESIAVVGSEPQIFFLARRHSATGYIYMYPLTEPHSLGAQMRAEFQHEIEAARPRYVVFVDIMTSWISMTASDPAIFRWWIQFSSSYEPVAAVGMTPGQPSTYVWDEAEVRKLDLAQYPILIYRRKL